MSQIFRFSTIENFLREAQDPFGGAPAPPPPPTTLPPMTPPRKTRDKVEVSPSDSRDFTIPGGKKPEGQNVAEWTSLMGDDPVSQNEYLRNIATGIVSPDTQGNIPENILESVGQELGIETKNIGEEFMSSYVYPMYTEVAKNIESIKMQLKSWYNEGGDIDSFIPQTNVDEVWTNLMESINNHGFVPKGMELDDQGIEKLITKVMRYTRFTAELALSVVNDMINYDLEDAIETNQNTDKMKEILILFRDSMMNSNVMKNGEIRESAKPLVGRIQNGINSFDKKDIMDGFKALSEIREKFSLLLSGGGKGSSGEDGEKTKIEDAFTQQRMEQISDFGTIALNKVNDIVSVFNTLVLSQDDDESFDVFSIAQHVQEKLTKLQRQITESAFEQGMMSPELVGKFMEMSRLAINEIDEKALSNKTFSIIAPAKSILGVETTSPSGVMMSDFMNAQREKENPYIETPLETNPVEEIPIEKDIEKDQVVTPPTTQIAFSNMIIRI